MRGVFTTLFVALIATACLAQTQQPAQLASASAAMQESATGQQGRVAVATGERTIVGCVAIAAPGPGYNLKTDDGRTLPLRGATDLAPYLGKKVQIQANWTSRGIHMAGPMEAKDPTTAAAGGGAQPAQEFAGDLHLQFKGKVIGDCLGKKK